METRSSSETKVFSIFFFFEPSINVQKTFLKYLWLTKRRIWNIRNAQMTSFWDIIHNVQKIVLKSFITYKRMSLEKHFHAIFFDIYRDEYFFRTWLLCSIDFWIFLLLKFCKSFTRMYSIFKEKTFYKLHAVDRILF